MADFGICPVKRHFELKFRLIHFEDDGNFGVCLDFGHLKLPSVSILRRLA